MPFTPRHVFPPKPGVPSYLEAPGGLEGGGLGTL